MHFWKSLIRQPISIAPLICNVLQMSAYCANAQKFAKPSFSNALKRKGYSFVLNILMVFHTQSGTNCIRSKINHAESGFKAGNTSSSTTKTQHFELKFIIAASSTAQNVSSEC